MPGTGGHPSGLRWLFLGQTTTVQFDPPAVTCGDACGRGRRLYPIPRMSHGSYICRVEVTIRAYDPRDAADLADVFFRSVWFAPASLEAAMSANCLIA